MFTFFLYTYLQKFLFKSHKFRTESCSNNEKVFGYVTDYRLVSREFDL